jgi:hypothetical protein
METFGGTDGGVRFIKFCTMLKALDHQAMSGDRTAQQLLKFVHHTARLIDVANQTS